MNRVAHHLVLAVADAAMDKLTRVAILEGALGVAPWSLARGGTFALTQALDRIQQQVPDIDEAWVSDRDMGVYASIIRGARDGGGSMQVAEDVAMEVLGMLSRSSTNVKGGELYEVGEKLSASILQGTGVGPAKSMLAHHGKHRALQKIRGPKSVSLTRQDEDGGETEMDVSGVSQADFMSLVADLLDGPGGSRVLNALHAHLTKAFANAPVKKTVLDAWLSNPTASAVALASAVGNLATYEFKGGPRGPSQFRDEAELKEWVRAHPGAIVSATMTSRILREIWDLAADFFKAHPELFKDVHLQEELSELGYGARYASELRERARKVAAWIRVQVAALRA